MVSVVSNSALNLSQKRHLSLSRRQVAIAMAVATLIFFGWGVWEQYRATERACASVEGVWTPNVLNFMQAGDRNCTWER